LDAVGSRTIAIEDSKLHSYAGGWAEYVRVRDERKAVEEARRAAKGARPEQQRTKNKEQRANGGASKNEKKRIATLERDIEAAEAALSSLEDELADPGAWATPENSAKSTKRHAAAKKKVDDLYAELEAAGV
jgi:ATP-binding cassette subfamily F protein 3